MANNTPFTFDRSVTVGETPLGAAGCAVIGCDKPASGDVTLTTTHTDTTASTKVTYRFCVEHGEHVYKHGYSDAPTPQPWEV